MRVLFDHQAFSMQAHGGVSRCFVELYKHFPKDVVAQFALRESDNVYIREANIAPALNTDIEQWLLPGMWKYKTKMFNAYQRMKGHHRYIYWDKNQYNQLESIRLLKKGDFDIFHPTFFSDYYLPYLNGKPFVLTIHDMIPELYPQYFMPDNIQIVGKRKLASLASAIVAVSEKTKEDVVTILKVPEDKVHVIYHGNEHIKTTSVKTNIFGFSYILYVGDRNDYKNFDFFIKYVSTVLKQHQELKVICTGHDFCDNELSMMEKYGTRDRFIHHWVSTDEELATLYQNATCFVYTSEYEGFGIPILEAYKADCPVMLNNASCFPEIAGDAAIYFEMTSNYSDFLERFEVLYSMTIETKLELLKKQRDRLSIYSWEKSARQLASLYRTILE